MEASRNDWKTVRTIGERIETDRNYWEKIRNE